MGPIWGEIEKSAPVTRAQPFTTTYEKVYLQYIGRTEFITFDQSKKTDRIRLWPQFLSRYLWFLPLKKGILPKIALNIAIYWSKQLWCEHF